jgi:uncharacterized protein YnzC (UPF0291/DUF896 family)
MPPSNKEETNSASVESDYEHIAQFKPLTDLIEKIQNYGAQSNLSHLSDEQHEQVAKINQMYIDQLN